MKQTERDWNRLTEAYSLTKQKYLAANNGPGTLARRINWKLRYQFLAHYHAAAPRWRVRLRAFGGERILPYFACVGPIKSGTSDLAAYLFQHPCIMPPLSKELRSVNPRDWRPYYPTVREKARVEQEHGTALSGYFTPAINSLQLVDSYRAARPKAKIILILRNPVDRVYSHYKWDLLLGGKRLTRSPYYRTFADYTNLAIDLFPATQIPSPTGGQLLHAGIYAQSVAVWLDRFGRENVHILRAEDFFHDIESTVCEIHEFLGIPPMKPELHEIVNQNPVKAPPMDEETRRKLGAFYRPWNERLYALIGRDLEWD